jgi:hypothetical protein
MKEPGRRVAGVLSGSWRTPPEPSRVSPAELDAIEPLLNGSGAAPLAWRRIAPTALASTVSGRNLAQAYKFYALRGARWEKQAADTARFFHDLGIRVVFLKGWTVARWYPERGLRPSSDIDVFLQPEDLERVLKVFADGHAPEAAVDLHADLEDLGNPPFDRIWDRSETILTGSIDARVIATAEHLRLLAVHMMRHGAWRPGWLCDIAVGVERAGRGLDWDRFFGGRKTRAWMLGVLGLAEKALGADISSCPDAAAARELPRWLYPSLIRQWGRGHYLQGEGMTRTRRRWRETGRMAIQRWPNPIQATVRMGGGFSNWPRLPYQAGEFLRRSVRFLRS